MDQSFSEWWGISDAQALKSWQGKTLEIHLITGEVLRGELVGYGRYHLTLKVGDLVLLVNKGGVVWYANSGVLGD